MRALLTIGRLTLQEAVRSRLTVVVGLAGAGIVLAAHGLRELGFGVPEMRMLVDCGFGAISVGGTLLAVLGTSHLLFADLDSRRLHLVLARPVSRAGYLAGKLAGVLGLLAVHTGALLAVVVGVLAWRAGAETPRLPWPELLQGGALLWVKLAVVAALALLVCSLAGTALFANAATLGLVVAGHLKPVLGAPGVDSPPAVLAAVLLALPDLQRFEPDGRPFEAGLPLAAAAQGCGFVVLYAVAAALVFRHREI